MKNFYYTFLFLSISFFVSAQDPGGTPVEGFIPIKRVNTQPETTINSTEKISETAKLSAVTIAPTIAPTGTSDEVGITEGQLSVSLSGGASYAIPIAVPPGINGVVPQVSLVYNSQGGNGIAGYGWNISGVSAITRIPRTKFHDGVVGGVNLDSNDRFALDGQRLILKSGATYGAAGTVYETENFSNVKITAIGVSPLGANYGPASFNVEYPDGSIAEYGASTDSRSITTWSITYWQNPQGVRISYSYILANNNLTIEYIKYGGINTNTPINQIQFVYKARQRTEQSYLAGKSILMNTIINEIKTIGNGIGFRNYVLELVPTSLGYEKLKSVTEKSGDGIKSYNPTVFSYDGDSDSESYFDVNPNKPQISLSNINAGNAGTLVADFDSDGKSDFIVYAKNGPDAYNKYWVYNDVHGSNFDLGFESPVGTFSDVFETSFLKGNATNGYKLNSSQGWTVARNNGSNYTFDTYALIPVAPSSGYNYYPFLQYTKTVAFPTEDILTDCYTLETTIFPKKILSGDFNGDGLTDVIAIDLPLYTGGCDEESGYTLNSQNVYFVDLKKDSPVLNTPIGVINETVTYATNIQVVDFNSDGKSDFMVLTAGKVTIYTLGTTNNLIVLTTYTDAGLKTDKPCLLGDYNGDGKTDFVIPQIVGQDIWCFYQATGSSSGFIKTQKSILANYSTNYSITTDVNGDWHKKQIDIVEYNYVPNDVTGDGKTDIVVLYNRTFERYDYYRTSYGQPVYDRTDYTGRGRPIFATLNLLDNFDIIPGQSYSIQTTNISGSGISTYPIPLFTNHNQPNYRLEFSLLTNNTIHTFNSGKDNRADTRLASITTGNGVKESITYKALVDGSDYDYNLSIYTPVLDKSVYPNTDIAVAAGLQVVSMLEKQSASVYKKQLFAYAGATSNLEGLGYLGFRASMRTNWFEDDSQIISSISKFDPSLRGANVENYTYLGLTAPAIAVNTALPNVPRTSAVIVNNTRTATETLLARNSITFLPGATITPAAGNTFIAKITPDYDANGFAETNTSPAYNLISKSLSFYETSLSSAKVFKLQNVQSNNYNILENTSSETDIVYDGNNNPTESITKVRSGGVSQQTTTSAIVYESVSSPYMVGRPKSKTQTVTVSGDSMTSKETYGYGSGIKSNLLEKIEKWGHNTSAITETNVYDLFGNITTKKISASGIADRITSFDYDATGRFLEESTDIEEFKTTFDYYPNGTLKTEKKQMELGTSSTLDTGYTYDSWFRKKTVTDYLGKTYTYDYIRDNEKTKITLTGDTSEGSYSEELFDDLGRKIRTGVKDIQGIMSYRDFQYDIYDRNFNISEPNTGSPSLWNTTTYDVYGRPETVKDFKGKTLSITYDKLATTVIDGSTGQTKISTNNAIGNVISMNESPIGGTINYNYFANGNLKETNYSGNKITITQDGWGRKTSLTDPSAGNYTYEYNALGEITKETTPNGSTTYKLYDSGKLDTKTLAGSNTDSKTVYNYGADGLPLKTTYTDNGDAAKKIITDYTYDSQKRLETIIEKNGYGAEFFKKFEYDPLGRVKKETNKAKLNGKESETVTQNEYKNGFLYKIYEIKNDQITKTLWETSEVNARGQLTKAFLGNGILIDNKYNDKGYVTDIKHTLGTTNTMVLGNVFNVERGNLDSRTNNLFGNLTENFDYDSQDRLYKYPNASGVEETQYYKDDGRIESNGLGAYSYANSAKKYQNTSIAPTPEGKAYYETKSTQTISYNTFKSPVEIVEGAEKVSFVYNDNNDRSVMFYGGAGLKHTRTYQKHYSADGSMEIKQTDTGAVEFVTYIGGDGYTAPVVYKKTFNSGGTAQEQTLYLHRDYQGSILAITNATGAVLEKRQFDAWGAIVKVQDGANNTLNVLTILDRGYTGHEHLQSVGLIHMNGRLYDAKLHRFLQPDNFVQDPSNTQNYNRYGYVLNNPLKYIDPSGEYGEGPGGIPIGTGDGGDIYETYQNPKVQEWLSKNLSARSFDKAGTAVGKAFRDGANWVASGISGLFGGGSSAPGVNVRSNVEQAQINAGNMKIFNFFTGISDNFDQGFNDRVIDVFNFVSNEIGDSQYWANTISGFGNDIMNGRSMMFNASDEYKHEIFTTAVNMSANQWAYAAGYSAPDIALSYVAPYALEGAVASIESTGSRILSNVPKFKYLRAKGGDINGFSVSKRSGYGAQPRLDYHKLVNPSKKSNSFPNWVKNKRLFHYHRGRGNNLHRHRPWEKGWDDKWFGDRF